MTVFNQKEKHYIHGQCEVEEINFAERIKKQLSAPCPWGCGEDTYGCRC